MEKLKDIDIYVERMQKSFMDKMFFIDKMFEPIDCIIDFGCANGVLIRAMHMLFPEYRYIGYDISTDMIDKAKELVPQADFFTKWEDMAQALRATTREPFRRSLLNISSTLHEVYSYGTAADIGEFWERVFSSGFRYIAIRDMMISDKLPEKADAKDVEKVRTLFPDRLREYENIWGTVENRRNLIHYLLKYRYSENWAREVRENYLPITAEQLFAKIPPDYETVYSEHYALPFIKQQIKKDCGIELRDATHFKILLKRKG